MPDAYDKALADLQREVDTLRDQCARLMVELQNARLENRELKRRVRKCERGAAK